MSGFTLLESIVAITIFVIATFIVMEYIVQGYKSNQFVIELSDAVEYAQKGIETMEKEIREASYADTGDFPIVDANNQSFTFYGDIDSDDNVEKVRYFLTGTNLIKGVTEPTVTPPIEYLAINEATSTISQYVNNGSDPIFYYYNGNYPADTTNNPLTTPSDVNVIKLVRLFLKINLVPARAPDDVILDIFVQMRNLKNNL